jgi:hypothetical protein
MSDRDVRDAFESGDLIDQAMNEAFLAAVRLHRFHRVPMALWVDGETREVDPYEIDLPEDEESDLAGLPRVAVARPP